MPSTEWERRRVVLRSALPWRKLMGKRSVRRRVQGVELVMPWAHLLPDFARVRPHYGQNLVELAAALQARRGSAEGPLGVLDIGANIGDSAAQILARVPEAHVVCVEADPYWARYLRTNLGAEPRATIEEALLVAGDADDGGATAVRVAGTTRFEHGATGGGEAGGPRSVTVGDLRRAHPELGSLRLVKSDTDGYDTALVPAVAAAWSDAPPVLFFEFDPNLTKVAGNAPEDLWPALADLGYDRLAIWDNVGDPLGQLDTAEAADHAARLEPYPVQELGYHFWDVAACHRDDRAAREAFDALLPQPFSPHGVGRPAS